MAQLRQDYQKFVERDAEIIAVGPEDRRTFAQYWEREQMPFVGLPNPDHTVADLYGQEVNLVKLGRMPAQIIIDKKGKIRYAHYGQSMSDIPSNVEILALLDDLNQELDSGVLGS
jgi:peroxiredoxin Q/BCP